MLARLFRRQTIGPEPGPSGGRFPVLAPDALLAGHRDRLAAIRAIVGVPDTHWEKLYRPLLEAFAGFVQQLPASEAHHHAGPGGLLRHGLEVAHEALKLRRGALLPPGAAAEELARLQDVWTYACVTAALLHDVGKPLADQRITLFDAGGRELGPWSPVTGPIPEAARFYRVEFAPGRRYRRHERIAPLLAHHVVPPQGLAWLASDPQVLEAWLATLQGDLEEAGPLGTIVSRADGLSVARNLSGGAHVQLPTARARPLAQRLLAGLRHLLAQEALPLNRPGAAGFLTGEDLWLVSKRVLDTLREHLTREGQTGIPSRNDRLMDELQQHGLLVPNGDRAVWTCEIRQGGWVQRLTCLRLEASAIWPDPDRRPAAFEGTVEPVANTPETEGKDEAKGASPPPPATGTAEPAESVADTLGDLPLPCDPNDAGSCKSAEDPETPEHEGGDSAQASTSGGNGESAPDAGKRFLAWLKDNIASGRAEINTVNARLHVLAEGLALVSPGIFRDFDAVRWEHAQKRFQKLRVHRKRPDGTNIWTCRVAKDRKQSLIKVMLIPDPETTLGVKLPPPNPAVTLIDHEEKTPDG